VSKKVFCICIILKIIIFLKINEMTFFLSANYVQTHADRLAQLGQNCKNLFIAYAEMFVWERKRRINNLICPLYIVPPPPPTVFQWLFCRWSCISGFKKVAQVLMDWMLFFSPNQQCWSTKENKNANPNQETSPSGLILSSFTTGFQMKAKCSLYSCSLVLYMSHLSPLSVKLQYTWGTLA